MEKDFLDKSIPYCMSTNKGVNDCESKRIFTAITSIRYENQFKIEGIRSIEGEVDRGRRC